MILYIILLILVILTYLLSKKMLIIASAYDILEKKHIALFTSLRTREEYLLKTYQDDLALIEYYHNVHEFKDLKERIEYELSLDSIDDEFDELTKVFKDRLIEYNKEYLEFEKIKETYPKLYKLQNYIEYEKY